MNRGHGEVVLERGGDVRLALQDLLLRVGAVRDEDQVLQLGWVDLLVLGGELNK